MFAGISAEGLEKGIFIVSIGSHLEVCDGSMTEAEEATEEKGTDPLLPSPLPSSFRLCFRLRVHGSH